MTQIYQIEEDRARGDRTLVIQMGEAMSLVLALLMALAAHACFLLGLLKGGHAAVPLGLSLLAWLVVILPWLARWKSWTSHQHEAGMYRGLVAWAITDVSLLILMWPR
jgi:1,4-dihydroxy-2-naphthoate octaprenyltransferase